MPTPRQPRSAAAVSTASSLLQRRRTIAIQPVNEDSDYLPFSGLKEPLESIVDSGSYRVEKARSGEYLHVSDLIGKCIRLKSLTNQENMSPPGRRLTMTDMLTFRQGDAIHDVLKERAAAGGPEHVWGKWKCKCGNLRINEPCRASEVDKEIVCEYCEGVCDEYIEVTMRNEEHLIQGHPDLILKLPKIDRFYVTELKSIAHNTFVDLERPLADHVIQVLFYWWLMLRSGYKMVDQVAIMYATKGWLAPGKGKPYKVFTIKPSVILSRLDPFLAEALAYARHHRGESKSLPARTFCPDKASPDARKCPLADICFGEKRNVGEVLSYADAVRASSPPVARTVRSNARPAPALRKVRSRPGR